MMVLVERRRRTGSSAVPTGEDERVELQAYLRDHEGLRRLWDNLNAATDTTVALGLPEAHEVDFRFKHDLCILRLGRIRARR